MKAVFADAFYFIAIVNPKDSAHKTAIDFSKRHRAPLVTTTWVLAELADGISRSSKRQVFRTLLDDLESHESWNRNRDQTG